MRGTRLLILATAATAAMAAGLEAANIYGLKPGNPQLKSISAMTFGPDGILFVGDARGAAIVAVETGDKAAASTPVDFEVADVKAKLAKALSLSADAIQVADLSVNSETGNVFLAVSIKDESPRIVRIDGSGEISELSLKNIPFARAELPNPVPDAEVNTPRGPRNNRDSAITDLAFVDGQLIVSGLSDQKSSSSVWSVMFPFDKVGAGTSLEIYHGAHGRSEDYAPIRTFIPFIIDGEPNLLAGYVCTPLVKFPLSEVSAKAGDKVEGTTLAELGNRNQPLDMIHYEKDGKDYLLLANSARGVMKINTDNIARSEGITEPVRGGGTAGQEYETIAELEGTVQLDKLNDEKAVVLIQSDNGSLTLKTVPLP